MGSSKRCGSLCCACSTPVTKLAGVILERIELATKRNEPTAVLHLISYLETILEAQTPSQKIRFEQNWRRSLPYTPHRLMRALKGWKSCRRSDTEPKSDFQPFITQCLCPTRFSFIPIHAFHFLLVSTLQCLRRPFPLPPTFMQFVPHSQSDNPGPEESPAHIRTDPTCIMTLKTDRRLMVRTPSKMTPAEASRTPTLIGLMDGRPVLELDNLSVDQGQLSMEKL
ncbi:hypothetical protein BLNAU_24377 [Blattamonas nauphoetae]|uniref:Uncharacterized protein n=1 Tax=Blattamonas nauphoetae TaxID=2049346 RepID=A0ABQ9WMK3_9EUKA|nr:hypothetical protein BLNAU_24377 [Blattamonas nauphoetae]